MNSTALQQNFKATVPVRRVSPLVQEADQGVLQISRTNDQPRVDLRGARGWFILSVGSLILAGLFALFLVVGRTLDCGSPESPPHGQGLIHPRSDNRATDGGACYAPGALAAAPQKGGKLHGVEGLLSTC